MKATDGAVPGEELREDTVRLCLNCITPWFSCPCRGHALFYPLHSLDHGWFVQSQELGPA